MTERRVRTPLIERVFAGHHDILAALRSLRRSPGFVAIAVLSLGLAIGLHTTAYSLIDAIRRPYIPYANVDRLFTLAPYGMGRQKQLLEREMYLAAKDRTDLFAAVVPFTMNGGMIGAGVRITSGTVITADPRLFDVLGVKPVVGRSFDAQDARSGDAAVINYQMWEDEFGENRDLSGLSVKFGDHTYRVVGVMGPSVTYPGDAAMWLPLPPGALYSSSGPQWVHALVTLRDGQDHERVKAQLNALAARFAEEYQGTSADFDFRIDPVRPFVPRNADAPIAVSFITFFILLIACLNLANLLLARGLSRRREVAVRMALGAKRWDVIRYVLTECAIIVVLGGAWGLLASLWGVQLAQAHMPRQIRDLGFVAPHLSWRIVAFGFAVIGVTVLAAGLLPAVRASRANVNEAMKDGGGGSTGRTSSLYRLVVLAEIAIALMMVVGATVSLHGFYLQSKIPFSYGREDLLTTWLAATNKVCNARDTSRHFMDDMVARAEAIPGVQFAAMEITALAPRDLVSSDQDPEPREIVLGEGRQIGYSLVSPDYYKTYQVPIIAGRDFERGDEMTAGAAIVNQRMAKRLWPLQSPVGRLIKIGPAKSNAPWIPVIGVSGVRYASSTDSTVIASGPPLAVVRRLGCHYGALAVRVSGQKPAAAVTLYNEMHAAMPGAIIADISSDRASYDANLRWERIVTLLFVAFGSFALVLSSIGVFAILSFAVGQRMREFAMRRALGADEPEVRRMIQKQAVEMVLTGTAFGAAAALILAYLVGGAIFRSPNLDPLALAAAEVIIIVASLAACVAPIRQAMRADPVDLLRST